VFFVPTIPERWMEPSLISMKLKKLKIHYFLSKKSFLLILSFLILFLYINTRNNNKQNTSAPITSIPPSEVCGDGIWNIGENINNCSKDANSYSIPPSDKINVLDVGDYTIGMYIFPAWHGDSEWLWRHWKPIIDAKKKFEGQEQPKKPILNYYDDSNPIAVDWMIKWGLEHGINLFIYDWYDSKFNEKPMDVFLNEFDVKYKPYKNFAKFAIMWANHNISPNMTTDEILSIFDRAASTYFKHPQYLKIENKPVIFIFSSFVASDEMTEVFRKAKERMLQNGYGGLYIILNDECSTNSSVAGFDGVTAYNYSNKMKLPTDTYDNYITAYKNTWNQIYSRCKSLKNLDDHPVNYFPPVSTGWDNTPWEGRYTFDMYVSVVINGMPDKFKTMLQNAKIFIEDNNIFPKMIIINAWDEWGEGSVLVPREDQWGFGYLEVVRAVFEQK